MFVNKLLLGITTVVFLEFVSAGKTNRRPATCSPVKSAYEGTNSIQSTLFDTPTHDANIEVCRFSNHSDTRRPSCCSRNTERELLHHAKGEFQTLLQKQAQAVMVKLHESNMTSITDEYRAMAQISRKSLMYGLGKMFNIPHRESYALVHQMFEVVEAYFVYDRSSSVFHAMDSLLDGIFVHVVRQSQKLSSLEPDYENCIKETRRQLSPPVFSNEAEQLTITLHYYLLAASYLAESISITEDILREIPDVEIIDECFRDFVKIQHCQKCYGYVEMQPCREICEDVYLVCLNQVVKMEKDWGYHMRVINILSEYLLNRADVQVIMNGLSREITSYTQYALNEWPNYRQMVESKCGKPKLSSPAKSETEVNWIKPEPSAHTRDMSSLYQNVILSTEIDLKSFFSSLPLRICSSSPSKGQGCWDGLVERIDKRRKSLKFLDVFAAFPKDKPELIKEMKMQIRRMRDMLIAGMGTCCGESERGSYTYTTKSPQEKGLVEIFTPREPDNKQNNEIGENSGSGIDDDSESGDTTEPVTVQAKSHNIVISESKEPAVHTSDRGNEEITYDEIVTRKKTTLQNTTPITYKRLESGPATPNSGAEEVKQTRRKTTPDIITQKQPKPVTPKTKSEQLNESSPPGGSASKNKISYITLYIPLICLFVLPWRLL